VFALRFVAHFFILDVAWLVRIKFGLFVFNFFLLSFRFDVFVGVFGFLQFLHLPVVLRLADIPDVNHGVVPVVRHFLESTGSHDHRVVVDGNCFIREQFDRDFLAGVGRDESARRHEADCFVLVRGVLGGPCEPNPGFGVVQHLEVESLLHVDPAVLEAHGVFRLAGQVVKQDFVLERFSPHVDHHIFERVEHGLDVQLVVELALGFWHEDHVEAE